jgi:hypothetical protein
MGVALAAGMTAAIVGVAASPALASHSNKEYVSTTGTNSGNCESSAAPCLTIAYAISVSTAGAKIEVAAGSYPAQLTISSDVTIDGAGTASSTGTIINPSSLPTSDSDPNSATPQYAIVDVTDGASVTLENLTVNGSQAKTQFNTCADDFVGIYYHNASGTVDNVDVTNIEPPKKELSCQDGLGVYVASGTDIAGNAVLPFHPAAVAKKSGGRSSSAGISSAPSVAARPEQVSSSVVTVNEVSVTSYDESGITCDDAGTTCTVKNSTVTGIGATTAVAQNGIVGNDAGSLTLNVDTVTDNTDTGGVYAAAGYMLIDEGTLTLSNDLSAANDYDFYLLQNSAATTTGGTWSISDSQATDSTMADGIAVEDVTNPLTVYSDRGSFDLRNGIALYGTTGVTVTDSTTDSNDANGIYVGGPGATGNGSSASTVESNITSDNSNDGILADTDSSANSFVQNKAVKDGLYDYQDLGTGNTWTSNECKPKGDSSPSGLC